MSKPRDLIRQRRGQVPEELDNRVKEHRTIKKAIRDTLKGSESDLESAKTIPEISKISGYPTQVINWHLTSMKKYGTAVETPTRDGQYHKWALIFQEPKKRKLNGGDE